MKTLKLIALSALMLAGSVQAQNLINNGNFETNDYAAFGSDYAKAGNAYDPSVVVIGSNPNNFHSAWASFAPISGSGMLIVNGGIDLAQNTFWSQTLSLGAGTYNFSGAGASTYYANPSLLQAVATIGSVDYIIGTAQLSSTTGQWMSVNGSVTLPFAANVQLSLRNLSTDYSGNDFVVDNLTLTSAVPEPQTYAMLLAGLGLAGFMARRRRA